MLKKLQLEWIPRHFKVKDAEWHISVAKVYYTTSSMQKHQLN